MFFIKKNTFFYFRGLLLQSLFIKKGFLAFFDGFDSSFLKKLNFLDKVYCYKFTIFFLSSNFISFFINKTGLTFFFFFKPSVFLIHGFLLSDFFSFIQHSFNFFLIGFSFNYIFFNNFFFNKLNNFFFENSRIFYIFFSFFKTLFNFFYFNYFILIIFFNVFNSLLF